MGGGACGQILYWGGVLGVGGGAQVRALKTLEGLKTRAEGAWLQGGRGLHNGRGHGARLPAAELLDRVLRACCVCWTHLAVGGANAGHLCVEFNQFSLELLQLLPLGAHALVVFAAGRRLARCSWLPVPLATSRRISPPQQKHL